MRNLKKILALALVFAMAFTFTAGAASFTDAADIGTNYLDDVNMLVELGVLAGYPDGSFGPAKNITRAEFAKMAYTLKYGSDADGNLFAAQASKFVDVEGNANVAWAKGYINYCANQNIVSGVGANKFNPQGNITVAEAAKMILVILGCDPAKEGFTGANWMSNVVAKAIDLGVFNGWAGDPSALATRELVAKLMRNAIFSPIYTYSAITGTGSQVNALGTAYNKTLGETTMGLYHVSGIVVANELNALVTNEEAEPISVSATADDEESVVYYTVKFSNGVEEDRFLTIDRGLDDSYLGKKVDVYFTADISSVYEGIYTYENPEVIGNVIVNSDTVVYEASAIAADVYPDTDYSKSSSTMRPYIGIQTADGEVKVNFVTDLKVRKDADATVAATYEIEKYAYVIDGVDTDNTDGTFEYALTSTLTCDNDDVDHRHVAACYESEATGEFVDDLGLPNLSQYRFVSVDGGKTFSYMFKTVDNDDVVFGAVTSKNSSTLRINGHDGVCNVDLEDAEIVGDVAIDDYVVAYRTNGKVVIEKANTFNAAVEAFVDNGGITLNGTDYYAWVECQADEFDNDLETRNVFAWFKDNNATGNKTAYYAFGNILLDITTDEVVEDATTSNYAIIISNSYDSNTETAYVKLGFADGTIATYQVGKFFTYASGSDLNDIAEDFDSEANDLSDIVVSYKIMDNGKVDLSAQDLIENTEGGDAYYDKTNLVLADTVNMVDTAEGKFGSYYPLNDSSLLFVHYVDGRDHKVKTYKIADIKDFDSAITANYLLNTAVSSDSRSKFVVAAGTRCDDLSNFNYDSDDNIAYVVSAYQRYNGEEYYAQLTLIDENGLFTATTVEAVTDDAADEQFPYSGYENNVGKIEELEGTFVRYEKNAEGEIAMLDLDYAAGIVANIASLRSNLVFYYTGYDFTGEPESVKFAEDGCTFVAIDEDTYAGENIYKIAKGDEGFEDEAYNAVLFFDEEDNVEKIFSFSEPVAPRA